VALGRRRIGLPLLLLLEETPDTIGPGATAILARRFGQRADEVAGHQPYAPVIPPLGSEGMAFESIPEAVALARGGGTANGPRP